MKRILAGLLAIGLSALAAGLAGQDAAAAGVVARPAGVGLGPAAGQTRTRPVIVIGLPGLRWTDVSPGATPAIWRLAESGSVGSLATMAIHRVTCPGDAWLTLNSGARATVDPSGAGHCSWLPPVETGGSQAPGTPGQPAGAAVPGPATIPALPGLERANARFSYQPYWGALAGSAPGCATAIGPGAALALAGRAGRVSRYLPSLPAAGPGAVRTLVAQCRLTVIDLGALGNGTGQRRARALAAADRAIGVIARSAPSGAEIMLAGLGDDASGPHLRAIVVSGPGYRSGLLVTGSTRQPGVVTITDLTPSVARWLGAPASVAPPPWAAALVGSPVHRTGRGPLPATIGTLIAQDAADQVTRSAAGGLFLFLVAVQVAAFALVALALRGGGGARRRVAAYTATGLVGAALPAGTFLAGLLPWARFSHPAVWLWGLSLAWAVAIGALALAGPWRREPFGPPGAVAAVTVAVIGIDVMTGSRLQPGSPFGLSLTEANRFYGIGNSAVGGYAVAALIAAAWAASAMLRRGPSRRNSVGADGSSQRRDRSRRNAVAAAGAVGMVAVFVAAWPGFGAKVGGTIALVPAFAVLLTAVGGARITPWRGLLIAASGVAVVTLFAVADYLGVAPLSHQGEFVGRVLHGGAGATLHRKISSNLSTLSQAWYSPIPAAVAVVSGIMLAWPGRLGPRTLVAAIERCRVLRGVLFSSWLAVVLAWLADDSGVRVVAAALPVALPLAVVLVLRNASLPRGSDQRELLSQEPDTSVATGNLGRIG